MAEFLIKVRVKQSSSLESGCVTGNLTLTKLQGKRANVTCIFLKLSDSLNTTGQLSF